MTAPRYRAGTHKLALFFAAMLIVLVVLFFITFAYGAYMVYNNPVSSVVAVTKQSSTGGYYLTVYGTNFESNAQKEVCVDPEFSPQNQSLMAPCSISLGHAVTDSSGAIYENFTISNQQLSQISSDGNEIHSVWIIGINGVSKSPGEYSQVVSIDSAENITSSTEGSGIVLFVTLYAFTLPVNFTLGSLFLFLWIIYILLFACALNGPVKSLVGSVKESAKRGISGVFDNSLLAVMAVFPIILWGTVLLELAQAAGGVSTGNLPPTDSMLLYVELAIAPLREEIGFRVIPIGVIAFLLILSKGRWKDAIMALWHPSKYLKKVDSPQEYSKSHLPIMYFLIAFSAVLFGLAHVLFGAGWGLGKISEAAMAGIALGALYFKYGLPSTILLHWTIDVALQTWGLSNSLIPYSSLLTLYTIPVAISSTIALLLLLRRHLSRKNLRERNDLYPTIHNNQ